MLLGVNFCEVLGHTLTRLKQSNLRWMIRPPQRGELGTVIKGITVNWLNLQVSRNKTYPTQCLKLKLAGRFEHIPSLSRFNPKLVLQRRLGAQKVPKTPVYLHFLKGNSRLHTEICIYVLERLL